MPTAIQHPIKTTKRSKHNISVHDLPRMGPLKSGSYWTGSPEKKKKLDTNKINVFSTLQVKNI